MQVREVRYICIVVLFVALPSFSQNIDLTKIEDYALDAYSYDGKRYTPTDSYFKLFKRDSAWLISRSANYVMRYKIKSSFHVPVKKIGKIEVLETTNLTLSEKINKEIPERISISYDVIVFWVFNGNVIWFHIKHDYKEI